MTTIPIEVIIQDAESPVTPTPTPESGGETNITAPDTGTISDVGSNSGGIGSSASIILPAIIASLAIGAIVAIIVRRYQKRKSNTGTTMLSRKEKLATAASGTIAILAATVLVGNLVIPATKAVTDETNSNSDEGELVVEDKITITVTREKDSDEAIVSSIENTSLATASYDFGYKVTASMAEGTTTANLYLDGNTDSPYYIAPVSDGILSDNTWGYTLSEEAEEYLAIPLADGPETLKQGKDAVEEEPVDAYYYVKIASDMPAGIYSGELEYNLVALEPIESLTYLQDFADLSVEEKTLFLEFTPTEAVYALKDQRDEQEYTVAKLRDGRVWMTKNLNLAAGSKIDSELSDVAEGYVLPVNNGFQEGNKLPVSSSEFIKKSVAYVYNTNNNTDDCSAPGCYSYYSWAAITAGSGVDISTGDTDAPYSICPKGWKLPNSRSTVAGDSDFYRLAVAYGMGSGSVSGDTNQFYSQAGPGTVANFLESGSYSYYSFSQNYKYWSSTVVESGGYTRYFQFDASGVDTAKLDASSEWSTGHAVRCVAR